MMLPDSTVRSQVPTWYGWVIVVIAALAMVATLPGRTHGLGMITERLLKDELFGLDQVSYSNINALATLLGGLFCIPCGWLIDRYGLRLTLTVTVGALAASVLWMTRVGDVTQLTLALLLTRGFGQSALSVISITMVGKWFPNRPSIPMAVYTLILSPCFAYAFQIAKPYANNDWRDVWGTIGLVLFGFLPVAALLARDPVRRSGSVDDRSSTSTAVSLEAETRCFTLGQAVRTQAFWLFGIAISMIALIGSGISLFNESVLKQQGFESSVYYNLATFTGMVGLVSHLPVGWLARHIPLNRLLAVGLGLQAFCMACLPQIHSLFGIRLYGVGMGIAGSITTVLFFTVWSQAFGRTHLGRIQSISQMMTVLASALGPRVFAESFRQWNGYTEIFYGLSAVATALALWACLVRVPSPHEAPAM